jgi:hypothetical protein
VLESRRPNRREQAVNQVLQLPAFSSTLMPASRRFCWMIAARSGCSDKRRSSAGMSGSRIRQRQELLRLSTSRVFAARLLLRQREFQAGNGPRQLPVSEKPTARSSPCGQGQVNRLAHARVFERLDLDSIKTRTGMPCPATSGHWRQIHVPTASAFILSVAIEGVD